MKTQFLELSDGSILNLNHLIFLSLIDRSEDETHGLINEWHFELQLSDGKTDIQYFDSYEEAREARNKIKYALINLNDK
jgi:hypothetical protein